VRSILKDIGLSEKEAEIYIFLAKHTALRSGEIAKLTKIDKAEVYRVLTNLQTKGLVEKTLEAPTRFTSTPFERAIDSFIKYKRNEATLVEKTKNELIKDWNNITKTPKQQLVEKFVVIEGWRKIYPRISQMIKETKKEFSSLSTINGYLRAEQLGIFDEVLAYPLKENVKFQFISEVSRQNIDTMQKLLDKIPKNLGNIRVRNPDFGFKVSPRMAIRDHEEILLFINPSEQEPLEKNDDIALWTDCRTIVQSFVAMFEELWRNSTDLANITQEGTNLPNEMQLFNDKEIDVKKYLEALQAANDEILIVTSPNGLNDCLNILPALRENNQRGVSIRIMAPLINDNFETAKKLSKCCQIRHIPLSYAEISVIDGKRLFQFTGFNNEEKSGFSNDLAYVSKKRNALFEIWKKATPLSDSTLESIIEPCGYRPTDLINRKRNVEKIQIIEGNEKITEEEIVEKIFNAKRRPVKNVSKDLNIMYANGGSAIVHPPEIFNLPDLMFEVQHINKFSSFGQGDALVVFLWLKTPNGYTFVPAGGIGDNPKGVSFRKVQYSGFPAEENFGLVKKEVLQVHVRGNTLFVGWTIPIPLLPPRYVLPPATLLIEGYGNVKTKQYTSVTLSGFKNKTEINGFDAFVTFMHPASKYSGPGTDGFFIRDLVVTMTPPQNRRR
jgi:sugar-specific transcriptional regulator TrmB